MSKYTSKKWYAVFYTEIIDGEMQKDHEGNPIVNITIVVKPEKYLHQSHFACGHRLLVLLVKETTQSKFHQLQKDISEVYIKAAQYQLNPLAAMIHRHAKLVKFEPYKVGDKKRSLSPSTKVAQSMQVIPNPLSDLLDS